MVTLPKSCAHVWSWFTDLHSSRSSNGFGPNPLAYSEIYAYFALQGDISPEDWELDLLRMFDNAALKIINKELNKKSKIS